MMKLFFLKTLVENYCMMPRAITWTFWAVSDYYFELSMITISGCQWLLFRAVNDYYFGLSMINTSWNAWCFFSGMMIFYDVIHLWCYVHKTPKFRNLNLNFLWCINSRSLRPFNISAFTFHYIFELIFSCCYANNEIYFV